MQIKLFLIPIPDSFGICQEMNVFLSQHKILEVDQKFFHNEKGAYWSFCVRYIVGNSLLLQKVGNKIKTDYKEVLKPEEFKVFSILRECRKILAAEDAVPAYAVFTDEELSNIAKLSELKSSMLKTISGIGDRRVEKYGTALIDMYLSKISENEKSQ